MYTPGLACRVSTREALRSLRGRLTDDIRLPKTTKTANDAAIGMHLAVPSGICARVADGVLHTPCRHCEVRPPDPIAREQPAPDLPGRSPMAHCSCPIGATRARYRARSDAIFGSREAGAVISKLMRAAPETSATVLRHIPPPTTDSAGHAPSRSRRQSGFQRSPSKHPAGRSAAVHSAVRQRQPTMIEIMSGSIA